MSFAYRLLCVLLVGAAGACSSGDEPSDERDAANESPVDRAPRADASAGKRPDAGSAGGRSDASTNSGADRASIDGGGSTPDVEPANSARADGGDASARDAATGDGGASSRGRSTGPGDWSAGDYPKEPGAYLELTGVDGQSGRARQYRVHVPPSYDRERPMPVVFCIHGLGQNALMFCVDGAGMPAKADAEGFILVMPNGYQNSWNAGTCCGAAASEKADDIAFMRALFKELGNHLNIDLARVYATGLSNGGYMSYRLACEASDIFVAVAPGAGAIGMDDIGGGTATSGDFAACKPIAKVSVLHLHGSADSLIPHALQKPSMDRIAMLNGCALTTREASRPASTGDTKCVSYEGCTGGVDVTGCTVMGGGHVWFGNATCGTGSPVGCAIVGANSTALNNTDAAWEFFKAHSRE